MSPPLYKLLSNVRSIHTLCIALEMSDKTD
nr:MAG TPA: hypothetical protein [Caudoviricetes sp.]